MQHTIEEHALRFRILGHSVRLACLKALAGGKADGVEVHRRIRESGEVGASNSEVRNALKRLAAKGYIASERVDDENVYYLVGDGRLVAEMLGCKVKK